MSDIGMLRDQIRRAGASIAPQMIDIPYCGVADGTAPAVGKILNTTTGNWFGTPTSYSYAWKRDVATATGTNSANYTTVAGDSTHSITCVVSATNGNGTTVATASNAVAIP